MTIVFTGTVTHNTSLSVDKIQVETSHSKAPLVIVSISKNPLVGTQFANPVPVTA